MGFLRLLLALAVVDGHTKALSPFGMIYPFFAVDTFFIISGFYMALILNEKYLNMANAYQAFLTGRFLRLYPLYALALIASLFLFVLFADAVPEGNPWAYFKNISQEDPTSLFYLVLTNVFIIGMDAAYFMKGELANGHIIPQAWSLSLEFIFYIFAPLLVKLRTRNLILLLASSIFLRICMIHQGLYETNWAFRFLPNELAFFLGGMLSYRIYARIKNIKIPKAIPIGFLLIISYAVLFQSDIYPDLMRLSSPLTKPGSYPSFFIVYFVIVFLGLPFIFQLSKDNAFDRWIGEFSYPVYILHLTVIYLLKVLVPDIAKGEYFGWAAALISFMLSWILLHYFIYPMERLRSQQVLSHKM